MKKMILVASILLGSLMLVQAGNNWFSIGETINLKSKILNEERSIIVYTPETYHLSDKQYPVMYLLDGGSHFHHASGIVQYLAHVGNMPEMIVIAITNVDRSRDFSPTHTEKIPTSGGAEKFMKFLSEELIPFVDKNYRTSPYDILVGHSFGGTFATYALLKEPDLFNAYIAISPYLMYDDNMLVDAAGKKLQSKFNDQVQFYMTVGDEPKYFESLEEFTEIVESKSPEGFELNYVQMKDENHGSVPHLSIYNGLEWIYTDWKLPKDAFKEGLASIDMHYSNLSKKYGYEITTPENTINQLGYIYLGKKEMDKAIKVFKENVVRYTKSANVYDSLGEAYEINNQFAEAEKNYQKAVKLAKQGHPNLNVYEKNLKRMQEKLAQM